MIIDRMEYHAVICYAQKRRYIGVVRVGDGLYGYVLAATVLKE